MQAFFIFADDDICYRNGTTKRKTVARSWNLSDDLGQIEYIFSDKTGTLTQNAMLFRQCSIGGKVYRGDFETTDDVTGSSSSTNDSAPSDDKKKAPKMPDGVLAPFHDTVILNDLTKKESSQAKDLYAFFSNLALCHTVLAQDEEGHIAYKAQSPDEAALVQAAADVGFVFLGRDKNVLRLSTPHDAEVVEFELLNVLEFSSARKRMSVVLRRLNHEDESEEKLMLLTKGADNVIFERLAPGNEELKQVTDQHLEDFANDGQSFPSRRAQPLIQALQDSERSVLRTSRLTKTCTKHGNENTSKRRLLSTDGRKRSRLSRRSSSRICSFSEPLPSRTSCRTEFPKRSPI